MIRSRRKHAEVAVDHRSIIQGSAAFILFLLAFGRRQIIEHSVRAGAWQKKHVVAIVEQSGLTMRPSSAANRLNARCECRH